MHIIIVNHRLAWIQKLFRLILEDTIEKKDYFLNCIDSIKVDVNEMEGVKITITRILRFDSAELFELIVSFGACLKFDPKYKNDYAWGEINLAEEFRNNGEFVTTNLISRISLLIAQITSSYGQQPLILPPAIAKAEDKVNL